MSAESGKETNRTPSDMLALTNIKASYKSAKISPTYRKNCVLLPHPSDGVFLIGPMGQGAVWVVMLLRLSPPRCLKRTAQQHQKTHFAVEPGGAMESYLIVKYFSFLVLPPFLFTCRVSFYLSH
jgi:hypothetical protein